MTTTTPIASIQGWFDDLGTPLSEVTFVIVDLETTGSRPGPEGITEIGAVKVRGGEVLGEFATLVDPGTPIPPTITQLTGITTAMVMAAPRIRAVLPGFLEFLEPGAILVAHNAGFDVGFLKAACAGHDVEWPAPDVVDTVKLARALVPRDEAPNHRLGTLAMLFGSSTHPNHRALADARATVDVLHALLGRLGSLGVITREDLLAFAPKVPQRRRRKATLADGLPHGPGVYIFRDGQNEPLYVGTSGNIHNRVRTYFTASEKRKRMGAMVDLAESVTAIPCATSLEAHVREIRLIAEHKPPYNRRSKNPERAAWLRITDEHYPRLSVVRQVADAGHHIGPFRSAKAATAAREALYAVEQIRQCTKKLRRQPNDEPCALFELGRCAAPCAGKVTPDEYDVTVQRVLHALNHDTSDLVSKVEARLEALSLQERFEEARDIRDALSQLLEGLDRHQRSIPLRESAAFMAARPRVGGGWEFASVSHGKLAGTAQAPRGTDPRQVIETLSATAEIVKPTVQLHPEETETILRWLDRPGTRLVSSDGPWLCPINGAGRDRQRLAPTLEAAYESSAAISAHNGQRRARR